MADETTARLVTARVYVQFQANGPLGVPQPGTVTIEATTIDEDGYDTASPGGTYVLGSWTINLTATPVQRPRAAVAPGAGPVGLDVGQRRCGRLAVRDAQGFPRRRTRRHASDRRRRRGGLRRCHTTILNHITEMGAAVVHRARLGPRGARRRDRLARSRARGLTGVGQGMIDGAAVLDNERPTAGTPYQRFALW